MRPDIGDLLRGLKKTFGEVILPSLTQPFAVEQATFMMLVFEHIVARWDSAYGFCRVENSELRQVLTEAAGKLCAGSQRHPGLSGLLGEIQARIADEQAAENTGREIRSISDANVVLRGLFCRLLECVEGGNGTDGIPGSSEVVQAGRAYLKRQLERDHDWVRVGEFVW